MIMDAAWEMERRGAKVLHLEVGQPSAASPAATSEREERGAYAAARHRLLRACAQRVYAQCQPQARHDCASRHGRGARPPAQARARNEQSRAFEHDDHKSQDIKPSAAAIAAVDAIIGRKFGPVVDWCVLVASCPADEP